MPSSLSSHQNAIKFEYGYKNKPKKKTPKILQNFQLLLSSGLVPKQNNKTMVHLKFYTLSNRIIVFCHSPTF